MTLCKRAVKTLMAVPNELPLPTVSAVMPNQVSDDTGRVIIVKLACFAPAATITDEGIVAMLLGSCPEALGERSTDAPLGPAGSLSVTVPIVGLPPVTGSIEKNMLLTSGG